MSIDQRALQDGSSEVENNIDSPTYGIHNHKGSEFSCCEKNNPPSSMVGAIDEGSKSSDDLENKHEGIQNVKTTGSYNVGDDQGVKKEDDTR